MHQYQPNPNPVTYPPNTKRFINSYSIFCQQEPWPCYHWERSVNPQNPLSPHWHYHLLPVSPTRSSYGDITPQNKNQCWALEWQLWQGNPVIVQHVMRLLESHGTQSRKSQKSSRVLRILKIVFGDLFMVSTTMIGTLSKSSLLEKMIKQLKQI